MIGRRLAFKSEPSIQHFPHVVRSVFNQELFLTADVRPIEAKVPIGISALRTPRECLVWLNMACLDAPLVAIAWQWLFARTFDVVVTIADREALFLTTWLIYLIDRFADSVSLASNVPRSWRQKFCLEHRNIWVALMIAVAALDAGILWWWLDYETLSRGLFLGAIVLAYLAINHAFSKLWQVLPFKEIIIGLLFAAGTILSFAPKVLVGKLTLALVAFLFACLCSLNCITIAIWECDLDQAQRKYSIATRWLSASNGTKTLSLFLTLASAALGFYDHRFGQFAACLAVSSLLLTVLNSAPMRRDERTALADLILLLPLLFWFVDML